MIRGQMPRIKNGCHVGCLAIGLYMTFVWEVGGKWVRERETEREIAGRKYKGAKAGK